MTISIIFTTCSKTKNTIFWSDSVKKKKASKLYATYSRELSNLAIINEFPRSKCMTLTVCKTCIFDKKNFRQRYKDTVNPKNKISSQTSVLSI